MVYTEAMSHNKGGLAIRTMAHSHTISDVSSPNFVLQRLEDQPFKDSLKESLPLKEDLKPGAPLDSVDLEDHLDAANHNPYDDGDDDHSVIEHSVGSGSNPLNSEGDMDAFRTPRGSVPDDDVVPPLEDRTAARRSAFRAKSEGMTILLRDDSLQSDYGYSPSSSQLVMGSSDGAAIRDSQYFELEFARREAENQLEQMKLQLQSKNSQLEQVQMVLMSYEEEIMNLRKTGLGPVPECNSEDEDDLVEANGPRVREGSAGEIALGIAEDLCKKIVHLQTTVQDLEEELVMVKLDNAQLKETNEFLKNSVQKSTRTIRNTSTRGLRNPFARH